MPEYQAPLAQSAEHIHGKDGVAGSIPAGGSTPNQQLRPGPAPGLFHAQSAPNRHLPVICQRITNSGCKNTFRGNRLEQFVSCGLRRLYTVGTSSLLSSTSMRANAPWCSAVLRRLRVERKASGEASSVMTSACAAAAGAPPGSTLGEGRLGDLRVRAFKLDKAFREVLVVMHKVPDRSARAPIPLWRANCWELAMPAVTPERQQIERLVRGQHHEPHRLLGTTPGQETGRRTGLRALDRSLTVSCLRSLGGSKDQRTAWRRWSRGHRSGDGRPESGGRSDVGVRVAVAVVSGQRRQPSCKSCAS
jgi:hypothetical protein